jgi:hypothetical protein
MIPKPRNPSFAKKSLLYAEATILAFLSGRHGGFACEKPQDQQVRGLERGGGNIGQIFVAVDDVAADHAPQLFDRDAEFLGRFAL